ncbi:MAG TPA: hypothetical protein VFS92_04775, partial [Planctomycetota bacterium]|nr:hypothetical protein [Planctomycetota bacterium]
RGLNKFAAVTATPRMHTGLVLQTADALIRWGVEDVRLEGPAAETVPEFERAVKELPAESGRLSLVHGGAPVRAFGPKARAAPRIERVRGAPAGIFAERSLEKPEAKPAPETPVTIAGAPGLLPRLGVVGDLPPAEERIVIEVDQSGTVTVDGARADSTALDGILAKASRRLVDPAVPNASRLHVVLRLDRRLPWIVANRFFVLAGRQELMVTRILFAAMPEDGGPEGAVAAFVPITAESGNYRRKVREDRTLTILVGVALDFPDRFRMRHLLEHLRESRGPWRPEEPWLLEFRPRPDVPVGIVLEAFDMMLRWGADFVVFAGPPDDGRRVIRDLVATTPTASGGLLVAINRERVPPDSWNRGPGEPLPRIRGRMAGLTNPEPVIVIPAAPRPKEEEDE